MAETEENEEKEYGGGGEIRTLGRLAPTPVFKTGALNRSATPPQNAGHYNRGAVLLKAISAWMPHTVCKRIFITSMKRHP